MSLSNPSRSMMRLAVVLTALCAAALAAACDSRSGNAEQQTAPDAAAMPAAESPGFAAAPAGRMAMTADAKVAAAGDQLPTSRGVDSVAPNMIIRNGNVSIQVDSLETAIAAVRALATRLGGYVGNVSMSTGEYAIRSATLEIKLPSARFEEAMTSLTPIGKVENSNSTAEDVGEEFVDINARMTTSRRLEERLVTLLATRTGRLEDVLAVERELARVRQEIERYEGRLRFLRSRVSMSTLAVTVHEAAPLVNPNPGTSVLGEAVRDMWRNFVNFIAFVISSLGVVIPVALILGALWWGWRRRGRGKK